MLKHFYNTIKRKLGFSPGVQIHSNGCTLSIPEDMAWAFVDGDFYEQNVIFILGKIIGKYKQPVFFDIGANYGYYSVRYSSECKKVFSFEPVSNTYKVLCKNISNNKLENIVTIKKGLSNSKGKRKINLYSSSGNNSLFIRNIPEDHPLKKIGEEVIELSVLDDLVNAGEVEGPDVIKIDVEGAEMNVLKGAKNTIAKYRPTILIEYSHTTSIDAGYNKDVLLTIFDLKDYKVFGIAEDPKDFRLIAEKDFASEEIANLIFLPLELNVEY